MAQASKVLTSPTLASFPITFTPQQLPAGIRSIELDNGSNLTLTLEADGAIIRVVAPYVARFALNTGGSWQRLTITAAGTPNSTDSIVLTAFDTVVVPPLLPSFGPSAWGAGAVPNALADVLPGDQFLAWQVEQIIHLLTGVMTGQPVTMAGAAPTGLTVLAAAGAGNASSIAVGDTMAKARLGYAGMAGQFATDSRTGDVVLRVDDATKLVRILAGSGASVIVVGDVSAVVQAQLIVTGTLTGDGRISAAATGASGKPLLNYVPLDNPAATTLTLNAAVNVLTVLTITGLPSSAVACVLWVDTTPAGGVLVLYKDNTGVNKFGAFHAAADVEPEAGQAIGSCANGQVFYTGSASAYPANWTIHLIGYWEPS